MRSLRIGLGVLVAALIVAGTSVILPSDVLAAPAAAAVSSTDDGIQYLSAPVDLPAGVWTDTPLVINLPYAGTYAIDANVRGRLSGNPVLNTFITARLWDATSGAALPLSERLVYQIIDTNPSNTTAGGNATAPISELITVTGPTTIRLQALDTNAAGIATIAQIYSDGNGYTSLRFVRGGD
jgi:hypothetical protein